MSHGKNSELLGQLLCIIHLNLWLYHKIGNLGNLKSGNLESLQI